ncbi:uncharacterized protein CXQ87_004816 [Candidozyma duobushaemuli]|uniref:Uncharacterized protein n=1 Tax=Candidozyma duobushaemuli TaxID=1231522 RepID=A0A2V1AFL9_9ASCO|nr:uncharacterized protein CXQ87_004816 [[Candida] duobushaemulonis]PVH16522.1 hypothetical protein CXQ87_004816 [[Candida] duobushaemulonis]
MPVTQHIPKPGNEPRDSKKPHRSIIRLKPVDYKPEKPRLHDATSQRSSRREEPSSPSPVADSPQLRRKSTWSSASGYKHIDKYAEFFMNDPAVHKDVPRLQNQYLRPNAKFVGEQQSGAYRYDIKVELKSVDLVSSINDIDHWRTLTRASSSMSEEHLLSKLRSIHAGDSDNQYIYMRWKEEFLLPDSRIKQLKNASFEGFYYVVLNIGGGASNNSGDCFSSRIIPGTISGLYYHTQNDKFQSLSLRYVEDRESSYTFDFA